MVVCDIDNMECMTHRCELCPCFIALQTYIEKKFEEFDIDHEISYTQWDSTDRTTLNTLTTPVEEFIELLVYRVDNLTTHSFIAKSQAQYLKERKENIEETTCIILVDFAENYHYVVQDEVQGYHWNKEQCTLHPVVLYFKVNGNLQCKSLCFISDDLEHDTCLVHEIQRMTSKYIKENYPQIKLLHYFSDGCAGQYKCC